MERLKVNTIWTIGHSVNTIEQFIRLLTAFNIKTVADVRSLPGSRKFPQFNKENLLISLPEKKISYIHIPKLGGRRKVNKNSKNTSWESPAFRGYADYMETDDFRDGIKDLILIANESRTAIMCAEVLWWRCHRSLISDYLKYLGWKVIHILSENKSEEHPYTKPARIINNVLTYSSPFEL